MTDLPPAEPLSLAEAKAYLRITQDAEDGLIAALITAARATVEALTRRALVATDGAAAITVPPPLVEAVRVVLAHFYEHRDESGTAAAFPGRLDALIAPFRVMRL